MFASSLHKLADVYTTKDQRQKISDPEVRALARAYKKERRRFDPDFDLRIKYNKHLAATVGVLKSLGLNPIIYPRYVTYAFEVFRRINKSGLSYCPIATLKSETFADGFRATLGDLKLNGKKARAILKDAGVTRVDAGVVITIAARIHAEERKMPKGLNVATEEAIEVLLSNFHEIGYDLSDFGEEA